MRGLSRYTPEKAEKIILLMVDEGMTMKHAANAIGEKLSTVCSWQKSHPDFDEAVLDARAGMAENYFQEIREIDKDLVDKAEKGKLLAVHVASAATRINSRQWAMTKLSRRVWGDRTDVNANINSTNTTKIEYTSKLDVTGLSEDELDALEAALTKTVMLLDAKKEATHE